MLKKYFPDVKAQIPYEGKESKNPLAFKYYNKDQMVGDKPMREHLRFAVAYWHSFMNFGADIFGSPSFNREWRTNNDPVTRAKNTMEAAFEFFQKLGVEYYCFHDRDISPAGENYIQTTKNLETMVEFAKEMQSASGIKLLWGTANLFGDPVYSQGAATSPSAHVMANAAAQVKNAIDATHELGGESYVFWGGREGYDTLLNTDIKREQEQRARFLQWQLTISKKLILKVNFS